MPYDYYEYCKCLVFDWWRQVDYAAAARRLGTAGCKGCAAGRVGSLPYVLALAALGVLAKLAEIYHIIGDHRETPDVEPNASASASPGSSLRRDLGLMASTVSALVYLVMFLGALFVQPLLFFPWILFQLIYIAQALTAFVRNPDSSYVEYQLFALSLNNLVQVFCVFLDFLNMSK